MSNYKLYTTNIPMLYIGFRTSEFKIGNFILGSASEFLPVNIMNPVYLGNAMGSLYQTACWYEGQDMLESPIVENIKEYIQGKLVVLLLTELIYPVPATNIIFDVFIPMAGEISFSDYYPIIEGLI
jgi:hypothetical protein